MAEAFDLNSLDSQSAAEAGAVIELEDPRDGSIIRDTEGKAFYVELLGMDSAKMRRAARKITDRRIIAIRKNRQTDYDSQVEEEERTGLYAQATRSWYLPPVDGEPLECNERNARKLYGDPRFPWLLEQIDKAIADRQRFFKKASPS